MSDQEERVLVTNNINADESQSELAVTKANQLIKDGLLVEAQNELQKALSDFEEDVTILRRLAFVHLLREQYEQALRRMTQALSISPTDPEVISDYVYMLSNLDLEREAINYISNLSGDVLSNWYLRISVGQLYANVGWHALAVEAYGGSKGNILHFKRKIWHSWWLSGGPVSPIRRFVRNLNVDARRLWYRFSENLIVLDTFESPQGFALKRVRGQIDKFQQRWALYSAWLSLAQKSARRLMLPCIAITAWLTLLISIDIVRPHTGALQAALTAGAITAAALALWKIVAVIDSAISLRVSLITMPMIAILFAVSGALLLDQPPMYSGWFDFFGAVLATEAFIVCCMLISYTIIWVGRYTRIGGLKRTHPREAILDYLLDIISNMTQVDNRNDLDSRSEWMVGLEFAAQLMEKELPSLLRNSNGQTNSWVSERAMGAAAALRHINQHIAAPTTGTWDSLLLILRSEAMALASGEFARLRWRPPPMPPSRPVRIRNISVTIVRTLTVMFVPITAIVLLQPIFKLNNSTLAWAKVASLGWALLYLLITVDPTLNDKITTARNLIGMTHDLKQQQNRSVE